MLSFRSKLDEFLVQINTSLSTYLPSKEVPYREVVEAMEYSLLGGGKRVRGVLVLAFYEFFGGKYTEQILPFAAAVEMVHAYSLVHDDLPCMDNDDIRRGKASCHIAFGESTALLAGDALLTQAFETLTRTENCKQFGAENVLAAIRLLALAAGTEGMIGGQIMDLHNEGKEITTAQLEAADRRKTGALFIASAMMGAVLAGAIAEELSVAEAYAQKIGLAFQIQDDVLDITSDVDTLGKPIGSDQENDKNTYTSLYGLNKAKQMVETLAKEAKDILKRSNRNSDFLAVYTDILTYRKY